MSDWPVYVLGHSLGAARAILYAWSRVRRGFRVDGVYAFAPPNPGDSAISDAFFVANPLHWQDNMISVKNARDLVTDVPVDVRVLGEEYVQPWPFLEINEEPEIGDSWGIFAHHHIELYQAGVKRLARRRVPLEMDEAVDMTAELYRSVANFGWVNPVDGAYCATRVSLNGARCAVFRGSVTAIDWMDDFDALQETVMGVRVSEGFWRGVAQAQPSLDARLAA